MSAMITYTLPTMQLVCHLVATGPSTISKTTPGSIERPTTETPTPSFPPGYVAYPDFGVAYKVHNELVSWDVAKDRCAREGGYLAAIDSVEKIQLVRNQNPSRNLTHVGFYLRETNDRIWYSVYTGLEVAQSSLPWSSNEPSGSGLCAQIKRGEGGLGKYTCTTSGDYVCQIPYPARKLAVDIIPS